jgi:hypothetical protein
MPRYWARTSTNCIHLPCSQHIFSTDINIDITIMDIIHYLVFPLENNVSETGSRFRLQVEPTRLDPIDRTSPYWTKRRPRLVLSIGPEWLGSRWSRKQNPISKTFCSEWNTEPLIMFRIVISTLIHHHHMPIDILKSLCPSSFLSSGQFIHQHSAPIACFSYLNDAIGTSWPPNNTSIHNLQDSCCNCSWQY